MVLTGDVIDPRFESSPETASTKIGSTVHFEESSILLNGLKKAVDSEAEGGVTPQLV
jgi:hypothetical protein